MTGILRTGEDLEVGAELPQLDLPVEARHIIMGATASRDWQPQHHDHDCAVRRMGLPDIIANTPTQTGWLSRYVTDWSGPHGRIGRLRVRMLQPVCPGDLIVLRGRVDALVKDRAGWWWAHLGLTLSRAGGDGPVLTRGDVLVALPSCEGARPWQAGADWQPPVFDRTPAA